VAQFIGENNRLNGVVNAVSGQTASVTVDGYNYNALAVNCGGEGSQTMLSIRPERVFIGDEGANKTTGLVKTEWIGR